MWCPARRRPTRFRVPRCAHTKRGVTQAVQCGFFCRNSPLFAARPPMKIKKLEICGFKSFVDRTVLQFDHDVICVVGPNGCGKSNVVDAIRWCMGEQSAK